MPHSSWSRILSMGIYCGDNHSFSYFHYESFDLVRISKCGRLLKVRPIPRSAQPKPCAATSVRRILRPIDNLAALRPNDGDAVHGHSNLSRGSSVEWL